MSQFNKISIPQPCHQSWQQMLPVTNGRHCERCCKTVMDFTAMTNDEVINYLSVNNNVCGRFGQQQLNNVNNRLLLENMPATNRLKGWAMAAGLTGALFFYKADAQTKPATTQTSVKVNEPVCEVRMIGKIAAPGLAKMLELKGCVTDEQGLALPGAIVKIPNSNLGTTTNSSGSFSIHIPPSTKQFTVSDVGFITELIDIGNDTNYEVKLREMFLGEVVIVKRSFFMRTYYKYIRKPFRTIFN